jgi:hypothetical protein
MITGVAPIRMPSSPGLYLIPWTCTDSRPSSWMCGPAGGSETSVAVRVRLPGPMIDSKMSTIHDHMRSHRRGSVRIPVITQKRPVHGYKSPRSRPGIGTGHRDHGPHPGSVTIRAGRTPRDHDGRSVRLHEIVPPAPAGRKARDHARIGALPRESRTRQPPGTAGRMIARVDVADCPETRVAPTDHHDHGELYPRNPSTVHDHGRSGRLPSVRSDVIMWSRQVRADREGRTAERRQRTRLGPAADPYSEPKRR